MRLRQYRFSYNRLSFRMPSIIPYKGVIIERMLTSLPNPNIHRIAQLAFVTKKSGSNAGVLCLRKKYVSLLKKSKYHLILPSLLRAPPFSSRICITSAFGSKIIEYPAFFIRSDRSVSKRRALPVNCSSIPPRFRKIFFLQQVLQAITVSTV